MLKVMIVDNEAIIRRGLTHCLDWEALGCTVAAQARDGAEAFEKIPLVEPDIIISDIRMPVMDGMQLAEQVSKTYPHIKIIILTGFPDFGYAQKAIACNVVDFVLKPTSIEQLSNAVRRAVQMIEQEAQHRALCRTLEDQSERNVLLERKLLLRDLIQNQRLSYSFIQKRMAETGLELQQYYVLFCSIKPKDADAFDFSFCLSETQKILEDCLADCTLYMVATGENYCYALVNTTDARSIVGACREAAEIMYNLTGAWLVIGISRLHHTPLEVYPAAREAESAQKFSSYNPEQYVFSYEDLPQIRPETLEHITQELKLFKSAVDNQNLDGARKLLHSLFQYIRQQRLPYEEVRSTCVVIYHFCINSLFRYQKEGSVSSLVPVEHLLDEENIDGIEQRLLEFLENCFSSIEASGENLDRLVLTIKNYIDEHYAENISLERLANVVHLSPSYLSKLFKRELGENISTYLQNIRIEKAKTLLLTTSMKSYEVAEAVGITNPVYFSRIFKRATGIKPKDYKNSVSRGEE